MLAMASPVKLRSTFPPTRATSTQIYVDGKRLGRSLQPERCVVTWRCMSRLVRGLVRGAGVLAAGVLGYAQLWERYV